MTSLVSGKAPPPDWLAEAAPRLAVLAATGLGLLLARVRVMGARLPVFTRYDPRSQIYPVLTTGEDKCMHNQACHMENKILFLDFSIFYFDVTWTHCSLVIRIC